MRFAWLVALTATLATLPACSADKPLKQGAQIVEVPDGYLYDANLSYARLIFPKRAMHDQSGYSTLSEEVYGSIVLTEYRGTASAADIERARRDIVQRYPRHEYSPVSETTIDGRRAWSWFEESSYKGRLKREYNAVVVYDDATYTIEFTSNDPRHRSPEFLEATVHTFLVAEDDR